MSKPPPEVLQLPIWKRAEIAFKVAVARAIEEHARLGFPIYIWRDGRVVELSPEEVLSPNQAKDRATSDLKDPAGKMHKP
ncbi:MAG: hypothetical protein JO159_16335 [Acidobacteria bacterium]|nr:hypothetical protein [Acidobacteriota bacterium]